MYEDITLLDSQLLDTLLSGIDNVSFRGPVGLNAAHPLGMEDEAFTRLPSAQDTLGFSVNLRAVDFGYTMADSPGYTSSKYSEVFNGLSEVGASKQDLDKCGHNGVMGSISRHKKELVLFRH